MKRYRTFLLILMLLTLAVAGHAVDVSVAFESKGTYICWFTYPGSDNVQQITEPERIQGDKVKLEAIDVPAAELPKTYINIMDKSSGNVAVKALKGQTELKISDSDFEYVGNVTLRVVAEDGSPIESGIIRVTDGVGDEHIVAVTPADQGMVHLRNVAAGQINVKVQTEGLKKTLDSDVDLPLERDTPSFTTDIRVSGDVNTVSVIEKSAGPQPDDAKKSSQTGSSDRQSGSSSILNSLVGLILLAIIGAVIWVVLKSRGVTAKGALEKLGVDVSEDAVVTGDTALSAQSPIPAVESNKCPFCGQEKDSQGNCACTLTGQQIGQPAVQSQEASVSTGPKLIGTQGIYAARVFELQETSVIGREPSCTVSLSEDSTVSRRHALITISGGQASIKDEGSSNSTFVNGAKVTEQILKPGDEVRIGESKFRFEA